MSSAASGCPSSCPHLLSIGDYSQEEVTSQEPCCQVCRRPGPNLWICLHKECDLFVGCGESGEDHSTHHFKAAPDHCLTLNLTTFRVWCYLCQDEVHLDRNEPPVNATEAMPHLGRKPILTNSVFVADPAESSSSSEEEGMDEQDKLLTDGNRSPSGKHTSRPKGLTGLQNLGNTCYMNAALQALSNCPQLTRFMLDCGAYVRKPGLSRSMMRLVKEIWNPRRPSYVVPTGIAHGIKSVCPVFKGYTQHDAQEFLRCFLDQLHEELKEVVDGSAPGDHDLDHEQDQVSDCETSSDAEYETCDSGLSSERSAFGDEMGCNHMNDEELHEQSRGSSGTLPSSASPTGSGSISSGVQGSSGSQPLSPNRKADGKRMEGALGSSSKRKQHSYRSIISDIFDGKLKSSVQCLTCDNVSTTRETFQDLSLPIPSRDHLHMLRATSASQSTKDVTSLSHSGPPPPSQGMTRSSLSLTFAPVGVYHWMWDWLEWVIGWIWGPTVSLQDCLSAFFSADELKGDNMYSCEKCKKLRNGVKFSKVLQLPETLCIHLKRFRHELMYSSKISSQVTFPLEGLDMSPYVAKSNSDQITTYDLVALICHHGTPASGHYTAYALNVINETWYEFDDQYVTAVDPHQVASCEAYVLFYRKSSEDMYKKRQRALDLMKLSRNEPSILQFYVSNQWVNRFNTFAEPGPITNHDFLCEHGCVDPEKASYVHELCTVFSRSVWEYLHAQFGGGPTCTKLYICHTCALEKEHLDRRRRHEYDNFSRLNTSFVNQRTPVNVCSISMTWFKHWEAFVTKKTDEVPGPIDNGPISTVHPRTGQVMVKVGSDHASLSEEMWTFLFNIYGGGPVVAQNASRRMSSPQQGQGHHQSHHHHHSERQQQQLEQRQQQQLQQQQQQQHQKQVEAQAEEERRELLEKKMKRNAIEKEMEKDEDEVEDGNLSTLKSDEDAFSSHEVFSSNNTSEHEEEAEALSL